MKLFLEEEQLLNRPKKLDIHKLLSDLNDGNDYVNLEDCYDNIQEISCYGVSHLSISASSLMDVQILEELMRLCYKYKNHQKVLNILQETNFNLFD